MKIETIVIGYVATNCHLILTNSAAIVVDPALYKKEIFDFLNDNADKNRLILITHAHFDHIGGAERLRNETGVSIAIGENENAALSDAAINMSGKFHAPISPFSADITLADNQTITVGDLDIKAIKTPGHTAGGMSYLVGNVLFSGDTLFKQNFGNTGFPGGNLEVLKKSIEKLMATLPDETKVCPGHGPDTTIGHEREYNPILR